MINKCSKNRRKIAWLNLKIVMSMLFRTSSIFNFFSFDIASRWAANHDNPRGCRKGEKRLPLLYFMAHDFREFNDLRMSRRDTRRCKSLVPVCRNGNSFKWK